MITLTYDLDTDLSVKHINICTHELTGLEHPSNLKDALETLTIQNPALTFSRMLKSGELFETYTEDGADKIAPIVNILADMWMYEPHPYATGSEMRPYMNVLHLFENMVNLVNEQQKKISSLSDELAEANYKLFMLSNSPQRLPVPPLPTKPS